MRRLRTVVNQSRAASVEIVVSGFLNHSDHIIDGSSIGSTLYRFGDTFGGKDGNMIIKAGVLDDVKVINSTKPGAELFAPERVEWVAALDGSKQIDAMP